MTERRLPRAILLLTALLLILLSPACADTVMETVTPVNMSGRKDLSGAFCRTGYGSVKISKVSADPSMTDGNPCYDISGARYTLYEDSSCSTEAKTKAGDRAVLTIGEDGNSNILELETGSYYMKETKAPAGYAVDADVHSLDIHKDKTTTYMAADKPKSNPVGVLLQKADKETGIPKPQGGASLAGAEYTVRYYAVKPPEGKTGEELAASVSGKSPAKIGGRDAEWVFRTDEAGQADMSDPDRYLVKEKSAELYRDSSGRAVFPIGVISVQETTAPEGYELDSRIYYAAITDSGQEESLNTLNTFTGTSALKEQVMRGDVCFVRTAEGRGRMSGVPFRITSLTTGESHILVTNRNGRASSAAEWNLHSSNTNAGETAKDGVWFNGCNSESEGAKPNDSLGALPYDTYRMEELSCEANRGCDLLTDEITIERTRVTVDLGTYDDKKTPEPVIETKARDDESGEPLKDEGGSEVKGSTGSCAEPAVGSTEVRLGMTVLTLRRRNDRLKRGE